MVDVSAGSSGVLQRDALHRAGGSLRAGGGLATWWRHVRKVLLFSPSLLAVVYFGWFATDRYVAEAQFIIRTASRPVGASGFGSFLQMAGLGRSQDDVFSVHGFLTSRDAVQQLAERLPLRDYYGVADADALARYPSIFYGPSLEELHKYFRWMATTVYSSNTGLTTMRVQAFRPEHAKDIADTLLQLSEQMVNRMNRRIQEDAVRVSVEEVRRNQDRLIAAQIAITRFRNDELMIDPAGSSVVITALIARLSEELAQTQTQLREVTASAPDNPNVAALRRRSAAIERQIEEERGRIRGDKGGLAGKLAVYERLVLDRELAKTMLTASVRSLESARTEARRQQLYLERVVEPAVTDYPLAPERARMILTVLAGNGLLLLVLWLIYAGVHERAEEKR
jgi:capsular polysaccharide transport system permease protein